MSVKSQPDILKILPVQFTRQSGSRIRIRPPLVDGGLRWFNRIGIGLVNLRDELRLHERHGHMDVATHIATLRGELHPQPAFFIFQAVGPAAITPVGAGDSRTGVTRIIVGVVLHDDGNIFVPAQAVTQPAKQAIDTVVTKPQCVIGIADPF